MVTPQQVRLFKAAQGGDCQDVCKILQDIPGMCLDFLVDGHGPLHEAAAYAHGPIVNQLLNHGASPIFQTSSGSSPFKYALDHICTEELCPDQYKETFDALLSHESQCLNDCWDAVCGMELVHLSNSIVGHILNDVSSMIGQFSPY